MRALLPRLLCASGSAVALASLLVVAACSGDDGNVVGTGADSGPDVNHPLQDASPDAADGSDHHDATTPDANDAGDTNDAADGSDTNDASDGGNDGESPTDSGTDAADAAPSHGPVTMNVVLSGAPEPGIPVVFQDSAGAILVQGVTDAKGAFTADVPSGSQVTVVFDFDYVRIQTVTGLEPGDVLTSIDRPHAPVAFDVTALPTAPVDGGAVSFGVGSDCWNGASAPPVPTSFTAPAWCLSANTVSALATDGQLGEYPTAFTYEDGVSVVDTTVDGGVTPVAFTTPWAPVQTMTLTTPDKGVNLGSLVYVQARGGSIFPAPGAAPQPGSEDDDVDAGLYKSPIPMYPGFPDAVQVEGSLFDSDGFQHAFLPLRGRATRITPPTAGGTMPVDLTNLLPAITGSSFTSDKAGLPLALNWTTAAPLTEADGMGAWLIGFTSEKRSVEWTFFAPPTATTIVPPTLPTLARPIAPATMQSVQPVVYALDVTFLTGYGDFKRGYGHYLPTLGMTRQAAIGMAPLLPQMGSMRFTTYSAN